MPKNMNSAGQYGNSQFTVSTVPGEGAYFTIQDAIDDLSGAAETIYIYPGVYNESITWPSNISVEGASHGEESFDVTINGNQTFNGSGSISFKNISFASVAGDCWTQDSVAATGSCEFTDCEILSPAAKGIVITTTVGVSILLLSSSEIISSTQSIDASGSSILESNDSIFSVTTDGINTIDLAGFSSLNITGSTLNTSGVGTASCLALNSASNSIDSRNSIYNAGNAATASAFLFTVAGASIRSVKDEMFVAGGTFWARSTGTFGLLSYGSIIINTGTTALIDPQITDTTLTQIPSNAINTINTDGTSAAPAAGEFTLTGGTGITTSGSGSTVTTNLDVPVTVPNGGTGSITLTDGGIVLGSGVGAVTTTTQPTDGQILVGSTGVDPVLTTLTGGTGISVVNAAGSVTADLDIPVTVPNGGTGATTLTDGGIVLGSGVGAVTITTQPTDGQILVGSTGVDPVLTTLTGGTGISVVNAAGSVTADLDIPVTVPNGGTGATTLTDGGIVLGSGVGAVTITTQPTDGQLLIGFTGADPVLATLTEGAGMNITNGAGGVTLASTAPVWSVQASGTPLLPSEGFISTAGGAQNFSLPATAAIGEIFELAQTGTGLVTVTQIVGQSIRFGNQITTTGAGGSLASSMQGDSIKLVCTAANTGFQVVSGAIGNWAVT